MKIILTTIIAGLLLSFAAFAQPELAQLQNEIFGTWLAGETSMPQPPPEMLQDIKSITFETNGIVKWTTAENGTIKEKIGRYVVFPPNDESIRRLPSIFVAPASYSNPGISSVCLLLITDVTVDIDARFNPDIIGKVLKGNAGRINGPKENVVFVRKKNDSQQSVAGYPPQSVGSPEP